MKTDLIIIGSGPGGYNTACHAAKNGLNTIILKTDKQVEHVLTEDVYQQKHYAMKQT